MHHHNPTLPDKTRQPQKNALSTHEKPDKTRHLSKIHLGLSIEQEHAFDFLVQARVPSGAQALPWPPILGGTGAGRAVDTPHATLV